jgi:hypothetical protein
MPTPPSPSVVAGPGPFPSVVLAHLIGSYLGARPSQQLWVLDAELEAWDAKVGRAPPGPHDACRSK